MCTQVQPETRVTASTAAETRTARMRYLHWQRPALLPFAVNAAKTWRTETCRESVVPGRARHVLSFGTRKACRALLGTYGSGPQKDRPATGAGLRNHDAALAAGHHFFFVAAAAAAGIATGLPSASTTCTSPRLSERTPSSIFARSPTTTQVSTCGSIVFAAAWVSAGVMASLRALYCRM